METNDMNGLVKNENTGSVRNMQQFILDVGTRMHNIDDFEKENKTMFNPLEHIVNMSETQMVQFQELEKEHRQGITDLEDKYERALNQSSSDEDFEQGEGFFYSPRTRAKLQKAQQSYDLTLQQSSIEGINTTGVTYNEQPTGRGNASPPPTFNKNKLPNLQILRAVQDRSTDYHEKKEDIQNFYRGKFVSPKIANKNLPIRNSSYLSQTPHKLGASLLSPNNTFDRSHMLGPLDSTMNSDPIFGGQSQMLPVKTQSPKERDEYLKKMKNTAVKHLSNRKERGQRNKKKNISASLHQLKQINESDLSFLFTTNKMKQSFGMSVLKQVGKSKLDFIVAGERSDSEDDLLQNRHKINQNCETPSKAALEMAENRIMDRMSRKSPTKMVDVSPFSQNLTNKLRKMQNQSQIESGRSSKPLSQSPSPKNVQWDQSSGTSGSPKGRNQAKSPAVFMTQISQPSQALPAVVSSPNFKKQSPIKQKKNKNGTLALPKVNVNNLDGPTLSLEEKKKVKMAKRTMRLQRARALLVDHTPYLLDKYRMGPHMEKPIDDSPGAPDWKKISHMPCYIMKEANYGAMKAIDQFEEDCRDKIDYLQGQINEMPKGKIIADHILNSPKFREGIFGENDKWADSKSIQKYNKHLADFRIMDGKIPHHQIHTQDKDMRIMSYKSFTAKEPDFMSKYKQNAENQKKRVAAALVGLKNVRTEALKQRFDQSLGKELRQKDRQLLEQVNTGGLEQAALTMCFNEDSHSMNRLFKKIESKLHQYLNVFFAGKSLSKECVQLQNKITRSMHDLLGRATDVTLRKFDIKATILNNLTSDEQNSGQLVKLLAEEISEKVQFFEIQRDFSQHSGPNKPLCPEGVSTETEEMNEAKKKFIEECQAQLVTSLPILLRIRNQRLTLSTYLLNTALCKGMQRAFFEFPMMLRHITLVSNDLSDKAFAVLLRGIEKQDFIESITYKRNNFGMESLKELKPLLEKRGQIKELHLINCKVDRQACTNLVAILKDTDNLHALSLVEASIDATCIPHLKEYIARANKLISLDLSYNGIRPQHMGELCKVLGESNRTLRNLNLSWNTLQNSLADNKHKSNEEEAIKHKIILNNLKAAVAKKMRCSGKAQANLMKMPENLPKQSVSYVEALTRFIKQNKRLQHMDLSYMGMDAETLQLFGPALRRCRSMLGLHLSGNPGLMGKEGEKISTELAERAHCKKYDPVCKIDIAAIILQETDRKGKNKSPRKSIDQSLSDSDGAKERLGDALSFKQVLLDRKMHKKGGERRKELDPPDLLVFNRKLGFQNEMPGSAQWDMIRGQEEDMNARCWLCDSHRYTLVFWTREFGILSQEKIKNLVAFEDCLYHLEHRDGEAPEPMVHTPPAIGQKGLLDPPQIYGNFNNWRGQTMYRVEDFCYLLDRHGVNIMDRLKANRSCRQDRTTQADLNPAEQVHFASTYQQYTQQAYSDRSKWRTVLSDNLVYRDPNLVNLETVCRKKPRFRSKKVQLEPAFRRMYDSPTESEYSSNMSQESEQSSVDSDQDIVQAKKFRATQDFLERQQGKQEVTSANWREVHKKSFKQVYVSPIFEKPGKKIYIIKANVFSNEKGNLSHSRPQDKVSFHEDKKHRPYLPESNKKYNYTECDVDSLDLDSEELLEKMPKVKEEYFFHQMLLQNRYETVPLVSKKLKQSEKVIQEKFDRMQSSFQFWKEPTTQNYKTMIAGDIKNWKVNRYDKDVDQALGVAELFEEHIFQLYNIYVETAAKSNFPQIQWLVFCDFCKGFNEPDLLVSSERLDMIFKACVSGDREGTGDGMFRYQFFEGIVRYAGDKYRGNGIVGSTYEAVQMFFKKDLLKDDGGTWMEFRTKLFWTKENDAVIQSNLKGLQRLHLKYGELPKAALTKQDCIDMVTRTRYILTNEREAIICFGLSKMAVISDFKKKGQQEAQQINFPEFIEFIGRVAHMSFKANGELCFIDKLKQVLDMILDIINMDRIEEVVQADEESFSDDEY